MVNRLTLQEMRLITYWSIMGLLTHPQGFAQTWAWHLKQKDKDMQSMCLTYFLSGPKDALRTMYQRNVTQDEWYDFTESLREALKYAPPYLLAEVELKNNQAVNTVLEYIKIKAQP